MTHNLGWYAEACRKEMRLVKNSGIGNLSVGEVFSGRIVMIFELFYFLLFTLAFAPLSSRDLSFQFRRPLCEESHQPF